MEHYKISKLLNDSIVSKCVLKKMGPSKDQASGQYFVNKNIRFKTMLRSVLCDYSDPYIVVKRTVTVEGDNNPKKRNKKVTFNNNVSFRSCISKNQ